MTTAVHTIVYADGADAARASFRGVLELPGTDVGRGRLILGTGPSELGVHPSWWGGVMVHLDVPGPRPMMLFQPRYDPPATAR